jgi:hypothetical protein
MCVNNALATQLCEGLELLFVDKISLTMKLCLQETASAEGGNFVTGEQTFEHVSDVSRRRIFLVEQHSDDTDWVCARIASEVTLFLRDLWSGPRAICEQRTVEWTLLSHLLRLYGMAPRPLPELDTGPVSQSARDHGMVFRGVQTGVQPGGVGATNNEIEFPSAMDDEPLDTATLEAMLDDDTEPAAGSASSGPMMMPPGSGDDATGGVGQLAVLTARVQTLEEQLRRANAQLARYMYGASDDTDSVYPAASDGHGGARRSDRLRHR